MSKTEPRVAGGVGVVLFIMWGIPSIIAFYMMVDGMINNTYDPLYLIITCINVFLLLIYGIACMFHEYYLNDVQTKTISQTEIPQTEV